MRAKYVWDRTARELVTAEVYAERQNARSVHTKFDIKPVKRLRRGTYLWRGGKWVHVADLVRRGRRSDGLQVMRDLDAYKTVAADVDGKRKVIGGRRQHREFLRRNGYTEVGNEPIRPRKEIEMPALREDLQRAYEQGPSAEQRAHMERAQRARPVPSYTIRGTSTRH